jgi:hypothetical protein
MEDSTIVSTNPDDAVPSPGAPASLVRALGAIPTKRLREIEKDTEAYVNLIIETKAIKLSAKEYLTAKRYKSRKEYFKLHWLKQKQKINEKNNNKDEHK